MEGVVDPWGLLGVGATLLVAIIGATWLLATRLSAVTAAQEDINELRRDVRAIYWELRRLGACINCMALGKPIPSDGTDIDLQQRMSSPFDE